MSKALIFSAPRLTEGEKPRPAAGGAGSSRGAGRAGHTQGPRWTQGMRERRAYQLERKLRVQIRGGTGEREREKTHQKERNSVSSTPLTSHKFTRSSVKMARSGSVQGSHGGWSPPNPPPAALSPKQRLDRKGASAHSSVRSPPAQRETKISLQSVTRND